MSLIPDKAPPPAVLATETHDLRGSGGSLLFGICFAIFTAAVGVVLMILPWRDTWNLNYMQGLVPLLRDSWDELYFRGAVTCLGVVNVYLAGLEVARLLKRA